jgi:uncharacterized membrane protein YhaH (DUF805 family)
MAQLQSGTGMQINLKSFVRRLFGRRTRGEFWGATIMLFVANWALLTVVSPPVASLVLWPLGLVVYARRLHDIGWTGWLGFIPFGVGFGVGFIKGFVVRLGIGDPGQMATIQSHILGLTGIGMTLTLGIPKGQPGENRFGPAPSGPPKEATADTFS